MRVLSIIVGLCAFALVWMGAPGVDGAVVQTAAAKSDTGVDGASGYHRVCRIAPQRYISRTDARGFFHIAPSVGVPRLFGDTDLAGEQAAVNADVATNLRNIDLTTSLFAEAGFCRASVFADLRYLGLGTDRIDADIADAQLALDKYVAHLGGYRSFRLAKFLDVGPVAGFRYVQLYPDLTGPDDEQLRSRLSDGWLDPFVGMRGRASIADVVYFPVYADVGGIGFGSQITWQAYGGVGVSVDGVDFELGYRHLYVDYAGDELDYAMHLGEPLLTTRFRF